MNRLNLLLCTTALTAAFVGTTSQASAALILQETSSYALTPTPNTEVLNFQGYNALGGVNQLLSVVVSLKDTVNGTVTGVNSMNSTLTFNSSVQNTLTITSQPFNLTLPQIINISNASGVVSLLRGASYTTPILTGTKTKSSTATGSLTDFLGGWSLSFSETGSFFGSADSGIALTAATQGAVEVDVTYTYSSVVPEPMSMALLGAGLTGIGVVRRRRARG